MRWTRRRDPVALPRLRGFDTARPFRRLPHRKQQVGLIGSPAIADAEIDRLAVPELLGVSLLVPARKLVDRSLVAAERGEAPFVGGEVAKRDSGIVLDDGGAVVEQEGPSR